MAYYLILFFILGCILGSFYQVVGERYSKGESIIKPKYSYCPYCKKRLKWYSILYVVICRDSYSRKETGLGWDIT